MGFMIFPLLQIGINHCFGNKSKSIPHPDLCFVLSELLYKHLHAIHCIEHWCRLWYPYTTAHRKIRNPYQSWSLHSVRFLFFKNSFPCFWNRNCNFRHKFMISTATKWKQIFIFEKKDHYFTAWQNVPLSTFWCTLCKTRIQKLSKFTCP